MAYGDRNRNATMRGNNRRQNAFSQQPAQTPYKGGVGRGTVPAPSLYGRGGVQASSACPPGQQQGRDKTGKMTCVPSTQRQQGQQGQSQMPNANVPGGAPRRPAGPGGPPKNNGGGY